MRGCKSSPPRSLDPAGQAQALLRGAGVPWARMLLLGISPAEAFGCLCPERISGHRGVAEQRLPPPGVVRSHPQAGRPRDLPAPRPPEQAPRSPDQPAGKRLGASTCARAWAARHWRTPHSPLPPAPPPVATPGCPSRAPPTPADRSHAGVLRLEVTAVGPVRTAGGRRPPSEARTAVSTTYAGTAFWSPGYRGSRSRATPRNRRGPSAPRADSAAAARRSRRPVRPSARARHLRGSARPPPASPRATPHRRAGIPRRAQPANRHRPPV